MEVKLIGVDIAKRVFQVCGVDENGDVVLSKRLHREGFLAHFATTEGDSLE